MQVEQKRGSLFVQRIIAVLLTLVLMVGMSPIVYAVGDDAEYGDELALSSDSDSTEISSFANDDFMMSASSTSTPQAEATWFWPTGTLAKGVHSGFGWRSSPFNSDHKGMDTAPGLRGIPIYAVRSGTVVASIRNFGNTGSGNYVVVRHVGRCTSYPTIYSISSHMRDDPRTLTPEGKQVKQGDLIGHVGNTGSTSGGGNPNKGNHLHFGLGERFDYRNKTVSGFINPMPRSLDGVRHVWGRDTNPRFPFRFGSANVINPEKTIVLDYITRTNQPPPAILARPTTASITSNHAGVGATITGSWASVSGANGYSVSLICTTNATFNQAAKVVNGTSTTFKVNNPGTYRISVRTRNTANPIQLSTSARESGTLVIHPNRTVTYINCDINSDGRVIQVNEVRHGANSTRPEVTPPQGWAFMGFIPDNGHINVTSDRLIKVDYQRARYNVTFLDRDGQVLVVRRNIPFEDAAVPPTPPSYEGWEFVGWDKQDYLYVDRNMEVRAVYQWLNYEIPIQTVIKSAERASDQRSYTVDVTLTNNHSTDAISGRIIVAIKTTAGKLVDSTIIPFSQIPANGGTRDVSNIEVITSELGVTAEVSVIGIRGDGNSSAPLSETVSKEIVGDAWSNWSPVIPPAGTSYMESATEFRSRVRETRQSASASMSGWAFLGTTTSFGAWSAWSNWGTTNPGAANDTRQVESRPNHLVGYNMHHHLYQQATSPHNRLYRFTHVTPGTDGTRASYGVFSRTRTATVAQRDAATTVSNGSLGGSGNSRGINQGGRTAFVIAGDERMWFTTSEIRQNQWRSRTRIRTITHTFEQLQPWSEWTFDEPQAGNPNLQVEQRDVHRYKLDDSDVTVYNYKRYSYENPRTGHITHDYTSAWADSVGFKGEWEEIRVEAQMLWVRTNPEGKDEYKKDENAVAGDIWFRGNINDEGNVTVYEEDTLEDTSGTTYRVEGILENAAGKKATLLVFHTANVDPLANQLVYVSQKTLDNQGGYDFSFIPRIPVGHGGTGDFIVSLAVEGSSYPITIDTIEADDTLHAVSFIKDDGTPIPIELENGITFDSQGVIEGNTALLPESPEVEGHQFDSWSTATANIRNDMTIVAEYVPNEYIVVLMDGDEVFDTKTVKHGESLGVGITPELFGGKFAGWVDPEGNVVETISDNTVLTAKFDAVEYTVTFIDRERNVLDTQSVMHGEEAIEPEPPSPPAGQIFFNWSDSTAYITEDMEIFPVYGFEETAEVPNANMSPVLHRGVMTVTLSSNTPNARVYYVLAPIDEDGEDGPTCASYNPFEYAGDGSVTDIELFAEPIEVPSGMSLYFIAEADEMNVSDIGVVSNDYNDTPVEDSRGITLNSTLLILQNGQTSQLEARYSAEFVAPSAANWRSSNEAVATVSASGLVTAVGVGTAIITAFNDELGLAAECRVDVVTDTRPVRESIQSVRLLQNTVTSNALSINYVRVPLQLVLAQNAQSTQSANSTTANMLNMSTASTSSIRSVTLQNDPNGFFTTNVVDDRFVELIPTQALITGRATSHKTRLLVNIDGTEFTTGELTIRINRTRPTLKASAIRFNSFFPDAPITVSMTTSIGRINNIELLPELDYEQVIFDSENMTLSLCDERIRNPRRLAFNVTVDGFTNPIRHQVSTTVQLTRPTAVLNVSAVSMRQSAELRITGQNISDIEVIGNDNFSASEIDTDGNFILTYDDDDVVRSSTRLTLRVNFDGTEQFVTRNLTVRPPPARIGIRLSRTTITLNRRVVDDSATILVTTTPVDVDMSEIEITGHTDKFEIDVTGKNIGISLESDTPTGTYRIMVGTARLTVRVVDTNPTVRITARGTFNVINPDSTITLTPRFTNYNYTGNMPTIDNDNFEIVSVSSTGVVTLRMKDAAVKPRTRQAVILTYDGWNSNSINITPRHVNPRLTRSTSQITLQANDIHSEGRIDISVQSPVAARISNVEIRGAHANLYSIREIQNGSYAIGFKDGQIGNVGRGASIRLNVYLFGSDVPVSVAVRIVVN
jgi:murein DD-endopeptidase MepM/ murein hydrolase activator NlpD